MTMTAARSQPRRMSVDSDPMKNACHEKPIFTRTMSPFGDLYNLYVLIALSSLPRSFFDPGPYRAAGPFRCRRHGHRRYKVCFGRFASLLEPAIVAIASGR